MQPVNLFDIASQQARWLATRQATVAGNIANVNTAGFRAKEVEPFAKVLDRSNVALSSTQAGHFGGKATEASFKVSEDPASTTVLPSKNSVVMENELMKAGDIGRSFELNTAIVKAFHRMMMMSVKV